MGHQPKKKVAAASPQDAAHKDDRLPNTFQEDGIGGGLLLQNPPPEGAEEGAAAETTTSREDIGEQNMLKTNEIQNIPTHAHQVSTAVVSSSTTNNETASSLSVSTAEARSTSIDGKKPRDQGADTAATDINDSKPVAGVQNSSSSVDPATRKISNTTTSMCAASASTSASAVSQPHGKSTSTREEADALFCDNLFDSLDDVVDIHCVHPDPIQSGYSMTVSPPTATIGCYTSGSNGDDDDHTYGYEHSHSNPKSVSTTTCATSTSTSPGSACSSGNDTTVPVAVYDPNPGPFEDEFALLDEKNKPSFPWSPIRSATTVANGTKKAEVATANTIAIGKYPPTATPTRAAVAITTPSSAPYLATPPPISPMKYIGPVEQEFQNDGGDCRIIDLQHDIHMIVPSSPVTAPTPITVTSSLMQSSTRLDRQCFGSATRSLAETPGKLSIEYVVPKLDGNCQELTDEEAADFCRALSPLSVDSTICKDRTNDAPIENSKRIVVEKTKLPLATAAAPVPHDGQVKITQDDDKVSTEYSATDSASTRVESVTTSSEAERISVAVMKAQARAFAGYVPPSTKASNDKATTCTSSGGVNPDARTTAASVYVAATTGWPTTESTMTISVIPVSAALARSETYNKRLQAVIPTSSELAKSITGSTGSRSNCNKGEDRVEQVNGRFIEKPWDQLFSRLFTYHQANGGDCDVPEEDFELHLWVKQQKEQHHLKQLGKLPHTSELTSARFEKLKSIGVFGDEERYEVLNTNDRLWYTMFAALCESTIKLGHFEGNGPDDPISIWVRNQRWECYSMVYNLASRYPKEQFNAEKMRLLDSLRFEWRFQFPDPNWGYTNVASGEDSTAANVAVGQTSGVPVSITTTLKLEQPWALRFEELVAFDQQYESFNVPEETGELYRWVQEQKELCRQKEAGSLAWNSELTNDRHKKLKSLDGFLGTRKKKVTTALNWMGYAYNSTHVGQRLGGHVQKGTFQSKSPAKAKATPTKKGLRERTPPVRILPARSANKSTTVRNEYAPVVSPTVAVPEVASSSMDVLGKKKENEKFEEVDPKSILLEEGSGTKRKFSYPDGGETVPVQEENASWDEFFGYLVEFKSRHGHCDANPDVNPEFSTELYQWIRAQKQARKKKRKSPLQEEHEAKLASIGFPWENTSVGEDTDIEEKWKQQFQALCKYKKKHGNADGGKSNDTLSKFAKKQRYDCRLWMTGENSGGFNREKKALLDAIGFGWRGYDHPFVVKVSVTSGGEPIATTTVAEPMALRAVWRMSTAQGGHQSHDSGTWGESLSQLSSFQRRNGGVPNKGTKLYKWFVQQAEQYAKKKQNHASMLSQEQVNMLEEEAGFTYEYGCRNHKKQKSPATGSTRQNKKVKRS